MFNTLNPIKIYKMIEDTLLQVYPYQERPEKAVDVYCDQSVDGGGWLTFQRRTNTSPPRLEFYRTWHEYRRGFGNPEGEFWLGLDHLHAITR